MLSPTNHNIHNISCHLIKTDLDTIEDIRYIFVPLLSKILDNPTGLKPDILMQNNISVFQPSKNTSSLFLIFPDQQKYDEYIHAYRILWAHQKQLSSAVLPTELVASCDFPDGTKGLKIIADTVSSYSDAYVRNGLIVDPVGYLTSEHGAVIREMLDISTQVKIMLA